MPDKAVRTAIVAYCEHCGDFIVAARKGQRYCRAPKPCRQRAWRRRVALVAHRCACGRWHYPELWTEEEPTNRVWWATGSTAKEEP